MNQLIEIRNLSKSFFGNDVLDDIEFILKPGSVHALVGENGAGKSTLVKIIMGEYSRDFGQIYFDGNEITFNSPSEALRKGIAMVHQELSPILDMTVVENMFLGREINTVGVIDGKQQNDLTKQYLDRLDLRIDPKKKMRDLNIAEMQMVEIAKIVSLGAKVIILDEPTSAITESEIHKLFSVILKLKSEGVGIIYISHKLDELFEIADEVSVLRDGILTLHENISKINKEKLINAMVGRELKEFYPSKSITPGENVFVVSGAKRDGEFEAIDLVLRRGEILGIAGLIGAGRSELVNALFGATKLDEGEIYIDNKKVQINDTEVAVHNRIALITEDRKLTGLNLKESVENNLILTLNKEICSYGVIDRSKINTQTDRIISKLQIKLNKRNEKIKFLSGGNQQKVVLGKWILTSPEIFIFDEPTRGIDVGAKSEIYRLMVELTEQGKSIIMVSSEMPELIGMCDRIIVLYQGKLSGVLDKGAMSQENIMLLASGENLEY
jgi:ABC-type sugar transport system ATPase subunit